MTDKATDRKLAEAARKEVNADSAPCDARVSIPLNIPPSEWEKVHRFWDSQPVPKIRDEEPTECGPIDLTSDVNSVRATPYTLPSEFAWVEIDTSKEEDANDLFSLLEKNYVEDNDCCFRFNYSREFLRWALTPPGFHSNWHVGIRIAETKKLVAFISAIPSKIRVHESVVDACEVNFLCVHKKLRSKRLAPVLIREITRRANRLGIWQALYTAGSFLPKPIADCRFFHRSINIRKLIACGFASQMLGKTLAECDAYYKLPSEFSETGIRKMRSEDISTVSKILYAELERTGSRLYPMFSEKELDHWLSPKANVVSAYVKETDGVVTDFFSFYSLPSRVIRFSISGDDLVNIAYCFYSAGSTMSRLTLLEQTLIAAASEGFDVVNALDLGQNYDCFATLKFGLGDGTLKYYLYNWKCPVVRNKEVGIILL